MMNLVMNLQHKFQLRHFSLKSYSPQIEIELDHTQYLLKTANNSKEIKQAFALRHKSFFSKITPHHSDTTSTEISDNLQLTNFNEKLDVDKFDQLCDHLVIIHKPSQKVIGTYRLNPSTQMQDFYSQTEFNLQSFVMPYTRFLELGRACIHNNHRNGAVISLLWKGIYVYMKKMNAEILFGCSSIKETKPREAVLIYRYFQQKNMVSNQYQIKPHRQFKVPFFDEYQQIFSRDLTDAELLEAENLIPSLLKTYIKLGAQIMGEPAYDSQMDTVDFLTTLKVQQLDERYQKRFENQTA